MHADLMMLTHFRRSTLSAEDRISYTNAVQCLQSKKAKTPSELAPGAKSLFDDWIVAHINQTFFVHYSVSAHPLFSQYLLY